MTVKTSVYKINISQVKTWLIAIFFPQYNKSFDPKLLQNWEVPKQYREVSVNISTAWISR